MFTDIVLPLIGILFTIFAFYINMKKWQHLKLSYQFYLELHYS